MAEGTSRRDVDARVVELRVADEPSAWEAAGFQVVDDRVRLGTVALHLTGGDGGVTGWTLSGVEVADGTLDGLPTEVGPASDEAPPSTAHPNGVTDLDHIVVLTPDLDRTLAALDEAGLELRRIRDTTSYGSPMRQAFFRLGPTILEVVSGDTGTGVPAADAPSTWFGLAANAEDLDAMAVALGDGLGSIKPAVQEGRRISTLRHRQLGLSVAFAVMDDHADRLDR